MSSIVISPPAGAATVSIGAKSVSTTAPAIIEPTDNAVAVVQRATVANSAPSTGIANVFNGVRNSEWGSGFAPRYYSNIFKVTGGAPSTIYCADEDLTWYNTFNVGCLVGEAGDHFRVSNGVPQLIGERTIIAANAKQYDEFPGVNTVVTGTTFTPTLNFADTGSQIWLQVAAIDASGNYGAWATVSYTVTNTTAGTPTNTTATQTLTGNTGALAAPGALTATYDGTNGLTPALTWTAVTSAVGYVVRFCYTDPATWPAGSAYLTLASDGLADPAAGDLFIFRKLITTLDRNTICTRVQRAPTAWSSFFPGAVQDNRLNDDATKTTWQFVEFGAKPVTGIGDWYLELTVPNGGTVNLLTYWCAGNGQTYYYAPKAGDVFELDFYVQASEGITLNAQAVGADTPAAITVGTGWSAQSHSYTFSADMTGTAATPWSLNWTNATGHTVTVNLAQMRPRLASQSYGTVAAPLATSMLPGWGLRFQFWTNQRPAVVTLSELTNPVGECAITLHGSLAHCATYGQIPWPQIDFLTKQEWIDLVAYLAAPVSSGDPMALKRAANGQTAPWTDVFSEIRLELWNETWNSLGAFWTLPGMTDHVTAASYNGGNVQGFLWSMVLSWMQQSPYWSVLAPKFKPIIGGRNDSSFGTDALTYFPQGKLVTIAAYNGGTDNGTGLILEDGASFQQTLVFAVNTPSGAVSSAAAYADLKSRLQATCTALGLTYGVDVVGGMYEGGPDYNLNGLNGVSVTPAQAIQQEVQRKSIATATATLDAFFLGLTYEVAPNFFALNFGDRWASHREDGAEYLPWSAVRAAFGSVPGFLSSSAIQLRNTSFTLNSATVDDIAVYTIRSGSNMLLCAVNRHPNYTVLPNTDPLYSAGDTGLRSVRIRTGLSVVTSAQTWQACIGNMRNHNRYPAGTRLNTSGTYDADPLCITPDMSWHAVTLSDPSQIVVDNTIGASAGGLLGGNAILIKLTGVS